LEDQTAGMTGLEEGMEELYVERLATHGKPESCVDDLRQRRGGNPEMYEGGKSESPRSTCESAEQGREDGGGNGRGKGRAKGNADSQTRPCQVAEAGVTLPGVFDMVADAPGR
jgi:hypothetical protein